jgi:Protein of unknown function (DUF2948)
MEPLKLIALDEEDLAVLSSLLQDAVLRVADMAYLPKQRRFAAALNRFEWEKTPKEADKNKEYLRRRTALRFDRVFGAKLKNVKPGVGDRVLSLLAVAFTPKEPPSGTLTLTFSGDASIQLEVECIEAELKDLGPEWRTRFKPQHPGDEPGAGNAPGAGGS